MFSSQGGELFERFRKIRRCGLVEVGVVLLKEVCHMGWALRFQRPRRGQFQSSSLSWLADQDVALSYFSFVMRAAIRALWSPAIMLMH